MDDDDDDDEMPYGRGAERSGAGSGGMDMHRGMRQGMGSRITPDMMRMHMRMMGAQARGARLSLKRGDSQIDIRCPGNENIAACVDAVGKLMDRVQAMPQTPR